MFAFYVASFTQDFFITMHEMFCHVKGDEKMALKH